MAYAFPKIVLTVIYKKIYKNTNLVLAVQPQTWTRYFVYLHVFSVWEALPLDLSHNGHGPCYVVTGSMHGGRGRSYRKAMNEAVRFKHWTCLFKLKDGSPFHLHYWQGWSCAHYRSRRHTTTFYLWYECEFVHARLFIWAVFDTGENIIIG